MEYYSVFDEDGQFKGAIRTILPLEEVAEVAEWKVITYSLNGRERRAVFTKDGCQVVHHLTDPTKGRGNWRGRDGERPPWPSPSPVVVLSPNRPPSALALP